MLSKLLVIGQNVLIWGRITLMLAGAFAITWGVYQGWNMSIDVTDLNLNISRK